MLNKVMTLAFLTLIIFSGFSAHAKSTRHYHYVRLPAEHIKVVKYAHHKNHHKNHFFKVTYHIHKHSSRYHVALANKNHIAQRYL